MNGRTRRSTKRPWHPHGTRPPAGSVERWPRGLASRMAMSCEGYASDSALHTKSRRSPRAPLVRSARGSLKRAPDRLTQAVTSYIRGPR